MEPLVAYLFPGQGSQYVGMGREMAENFPSAREVFEEADEALRFSLSRLCFEGPAEDLQLTENTQPAILATSIAILRALEGEGLERPCYLAGHSLGEYTALVAAGSLGLSAAVRLVRLRGRLMQEAVAVGVGAMAAILGLDRETVEDVCREVRLSGEVLSPANINSPAQIVIAGHAVAVDRAILAMKERGAKRAIKLNVSAPFHCALMKPAEERLAEVLVDIEFKELRTPVITNVDARAVRAGDEARDALVRQVSSPVRWQESVALMVEELGVGKFYEIGPGKVLCGLARQITSGAQCVNVEDIASLRKAVSAKE